MKAVLLIFFWATLVGGYGLVTYALAKEGGVWNWFTGLFLTWFAWWLAAGLWDVTKTYLES